MEREYHYCQPVRCKVCKELVTFPNFNGAYSRTLNGEVCYNCIEDSVKNPSSTGFVPVIPNVTKLEHDLIMNGIGKNEFFATPCYGDVPNGCILVDDLTETCEEITPAQMSGVVSSIIKKVLVVPQNVKGYKSLQLTAEGYTYYLRNRGE